MLHHLAAASLILSLGLSPVPDVDTSGHAVEAPHQEVRFEAESRNTAENARNTAALLETGARPWLLVTSAAHMPRAVATFRAEGLSVLPYPVDYRTEPDNLVWPRDLGGSLSDAGVALHEWLGLVVYYVTERSSALFPAP